jgi:hypothetical protein
MSYQKSSNRIELNEVDLSKIFSYFNNHGKPLILTEKGRGVAAIIPYVDPETMKMNSKRKIYEFKIR